MAMGPSPASGLSAESARRLRVALSAGWRPAAHFAADDCVLGFGKCLLEVGPQLAHVLEPDAEPNQAFRHPLALPAPPRLERRPHPAEAGGVSDQPGRGLDR